jgi:fumarate hydratase subunit beta
MDKFTELMYSNGLAATIGKGERSEEAEEIIKKYNGKYFSAAGGISCLLAQTVKSSEIVAFEDLGTEAIRKLYVEKLPVTVEI